MVDLNDIPARDRLAEAKESAQNAATLADGVTAFASCHTFAAAAKEAADWCAELGEVDVEFAEKLCDFAEMCYDLCLDMEGAQNA